MSGLSNFGLTSAGFSEPNTTNIENAIFSDLTSAIGPQINLNAGSMFATFTGIFATQLQKVWDLAAAVYLSQYPDSAVGTQEDNAVSLNNVTRKPATYSTIPQNTALGIPGQIFFGTVGTPIPQGTQLSVAGAPTSIFTTDNAVTLVAGTNEVQTLTASSTPTGGTFTLSFAGQTTTAISYTATASTIQTALQALSTIGSGNVTVTGSWAAGFAITFQGSLGLQPQYLITAASSLTAGGAVTLTVAETTKGVVQGATTMTCTQTGAIAANAGTLTTFVNPIAGVTSTTNTVGANLGAAAESDSALRIRRKSLLASPASSTLPGMQAALLAVSGVTSVLIIQNNSDSSASDGSGFTMPPHSFECFISGGSDTAICAAIWACKPAGIQSTGQITSSTVDSTGNTQTVKYSRPTQVPIYVIAELTTNSNYPSNGDASVQTAIVNYINALGQGNSVIVTPGLVSALSAIPGITGVTLLVGTAPSPASSNNIAINSTQVAYTQNAYVTVTP